MIAPERIMPKLREQAAMFNHYVSKKEYWNAVKIYNRAIGIAVFIELGDAECIELFGDGGYRKGREEQIPGLFHTASVEKAVLESCIKGNRSIQKLTYEEVMEGVRLC